jgi:hypothetical protein
MKKHFIMMIMAVSTVLVGCQYDDDFTPPNYVTFEQVKSANLGVELGGTTTHEITVYAANTTGSDRTFDLEVSDATTLDASGYTLPASVTIPAGSNEGTFTVEVGDVNLGLLGKKLVIDLAETSELASGSSYTVNVNRTCVGTEFVIAFEFDGYASETDWTLEDEDGNEVVSGGGYANGTASASRSLCLDPGIYTFSVTDSYGDGLTYPTTGSITISYGGEDIVVIPGAYGTGTSVTVSIGPDGGSVVDGDDTND